VPSAPEAVDWCAAIWRTCIAVLKNRQHLRGGVQTQVACHRRAALYPERFAGDGNNGEAEAPMVRFADVGCGFGGLLIRLSPLYPDKLMVGFELRDKVRRRRPLAPPADCSMVSGGPPQALVRYDHWWVL